MTAALIGIMKNRDELVDLMNVQVSRFDQMSYEAWEIFERKSEIPLINSC